ncbi:MAG: WecB/TagA/CpsF family glycosyltransferase [Ferruginibacter sp.]
MLKFGRQALKEFSISTGKYRLFIEEITRLAKERVSATVYFANVHMFIEAHQDKDFLELINKCDVVTPDGQPLAWVLRLLYGIKQDRVSAMDMLPDLLKQMEQEDLPVYFYGGTQKMLDQTAVFIDKQYPKLKIAGLYSPPFRPLTEDERKEITEKINNAMPAIVFVFLGCPKQEKWMAAMKGKINAVMAGVGGAVPVTIGLQKRAPVWMRNYALEWLYRLFQEPKRLFKRYTVTNSIFIWVIFKEFVKLRIIKPLGFSKA